MSILKIKFSHYYPKLHDQTEAKLVHVAKLSAREVQENKDLLEYDTKYIIGLQNLTIDHSQYAYYQLPKTGELIYLVFVGNKGIPFCTLRKYEPLKWEYYTSNKGNEFKIVIGENK